MGVAQHAQQVAEVLLGADHSRLLEHARVGLLDEVLGVLARAAQGPGGTVEAVEVVAQVVGVEAARRGGYGCGGARKGVVSGNPHRLEGLWRRRAPSRDWPMAIRLSDTQLQRQSWG